MKINNETKVGVLAVAAILILVIGFNFLKGKQIFKKQPTLYAIFKNLGSLEKSNVVKVNGLPIGTVYDFAPTNKEVDSILVEIHLNRDVHIPDNSVALIDGSVLGAAYITIEKGPSKNFLESGDTINTRLDEGLIASLKTQISPTITRVNETLDSLKIAVGGINSMLDDNTKGNLRSMISSLAV